MARILHPIKIKVKVNAREKIIIMAEMSHLIKMKMKVNTS